MEATDAGRVLAGLNPSQREAATAVRGPVCILAGAGTGKTRTITHRIAQQVVSGVAEPGQILAVTFTDKAAAELRARLQALGLPAPVRAATFHAAAWAQLRWFWPRLDAGPLPEVAPSKLRLLAPLARRAGVSPQDLAAEIEWAKARRLTPETYADAAGDRAAPLPSGRMAAVYADYEQAKTAAGQIDYEDMLLRMTAAVTDHPDVAAEVRDRYRFFTVDEFQDVNPAQFALLRAWLGDRDEVCVVGDDDQTIYSFTGATAAYLSEFERHFPGARRVTLTRNYRSTPEVLELANAVLWTKPAGRRKRLTATLGSGPAPAFREFDDDEAEVRGVVKRIAELLDDGVAPGDIAVCYRVNSQSEPYEVALRDAGVPYIVRGAGSFYERREVRQALLVLRGAAANPPAAPLGLEDTVPAHPPRADEQVRRVLREQLRFDDRHEPDGDAARERWRNLRAVVEVAVRAVAERPDATLADVVALLMRRAAEGAEAASDDGAVTLLTLHKAKGLEFDAVFLVALEEGLLPISHARTDAEVEEERRLFYVGVTRARRHLWLSWARQRTGFGDRVVSRRPSRLLYNLGAGAPRSGGGQRTSAAGRNGGVARKGGAAARTSGVATACACGQRLASPADRRRRACWTCFSDGANPQLTEQLRRWRSERARSDAVPAFVVFDDRTLVALARSRPATVSELLAVPGVGPAKADRYGNELLALLAECGA